MPTPRPQNQSGATRCYCQTPARKSKKREKVLRMDRWKLRPSERLYFALEDLDISFTPAEVQRVIWMWEHGQSFLEIAEALRPGEDGQYEVFALLMDLARKGKIEKRPGGILV